MKAFATNLFVAIAGVIGLLLCSGLSCGLGYLIVKLLGENFMEWLFTCHILIQFFFLTIGIIWLLTAAPFILVFFPSALDFSMSSFSY